MKRLVALIAALLMLAMLFSFSACAGTDKDDVFEPDEELNYAAKDVLASLGKDRRIDEYLKIRPSLVRYKNSTRRNAIEGELDALKSTYTGIGSDLSFESGAKYVNERLFDYLVEGTYYSKAQFDEALLGPTPGLTDSIVSLGYKLVYEFKNNGGHVATKYYYGNHDVHDDLNYYSISMTESGSVEYLSVPVYYEPLTEQFVSSYAEKSAEERAAVFDESVRFFAEKADVCSNPVLKYIYNDQELTALQNFLNSLNVGYLDEHNVSIEEEPYSNRQIPVELGSTRFILRITIYGMFMDVIQNKDYYHGSFFTGLDTLRRAYIGSEPTSINDDIYIVIG